MDSLIFNGISYKLKLRHRGAWVDTKNLCLNIEGNYYEAVPLTSSKQEDWKADYALVVSSSTHISQVTDWIEKHAERIYLQTRKTLKP
jgi:hypothetical protein